MGLNTVRTLIRLNSESHKGKTHSEETRRKISEALKSKNMIPSDLQSLRPSRGEAVRSTDWYKRKIRSLGYSDLTAVQAMSDEMGALTRTIDIGSMYLFGYDPKTKARLPYYDQFPLIFPFRKTQTGFYGINFHYLPYLTRVRLLDELLPYATAKKNLTETTRLRLTWNVLKKYAAAKPCVKQYLAQHIFSPQLLKIDPRDWRTTLLLPIEDFVGASSKKVHTISRNSF
jgi:hypothetical protein